MTQCPSAKYATASVAEFLYFVKIFCNFHLSLWRKKESLLKADKAVCEKNDRNCDWKRSYQAVSSMANCLKAL